MEKASSSGPASLTEPSRAAEEPFYRTIVNQAHEGIWTIDPQGCTTFVNTRMARLLGYEPEELSGRVHTDFMFEEDRPHGDLQMELRRIGRTQTWDQRYRRKDGSELWTIASCCPLFENGQFTGALGMFSDITDRKRLERALQESESRFRGTFETAAVGVAHVGLDGRWLRMNRKLCELLGYTHAELMPLTFRDITHPEDLVADVAQVERMLRREITTYTMEKRYRRKSGQFFWGELTVSMLCDEIGEPIHFISIVQDISDRMRATEELRISREQVIAGSRAKDQFLAALSHELRAPLSPVMLLAGDAAADPETPGHLRETFRSIEEAVAQQTRIIDDLLDLTRITAGKLSLLREPVELRRFLETLVKQMQPDAARKQISMTLRAGSEMAVMRADQGRMRQVLHNLIGNALKFTPIGGRVSVELGIDAAKAEATISVSDTGIGMNADELTRLFERFSQGDHARQVPGKFGGLGLGLTICKGLVEQHGGTLTAHSVGRNNGSTFTVRLPLIG